MRAAPARQRLGWDAQPRLGVALVVWEGTRTGPRALTIRHAHGHLTIRPCGRGAHHGPAVEGFMHAALRSPRIARTVATPRPGTNTHRRTGHSRRTKDRDQHPSEIYRVASAPKRYGADTAHPPDSESCVLQAP